MPRTDFLGLNWQSLCMVGGRAQQTRLLRARFICLLAGYEAAEGSSEKYGECGFDVLLSASRLILMAARLIRCVLHHDSRLIGSIERGA